MESTGNSSISGDRKASKKTVASSTTAKTNGKSPVSSRNSMNPNTVTALSSAHANQVMFFRDVSLGPRETELRFRLIHLWETRNIYTKTLIGQEMLLIDEEGTVIQGFVPAGRVGTFDLVAGSVYKLSNFFGCRDKAHFSVADHIAIVSFSWNSDVSIRENPPFLIPEDRFRFHSFEEFMANCDSKGDLYDYVGHMRLVNGQTLTDHIVLEEVAIAEKRHLCVHVQTHEPVMKLYLWDNAASEFCQKFKSYGRTPHVLLVTTVNPKHLGGTLCLTSMSSSRVVMDDDVQPSKDYIEWLSSNTGSANRIAAEVVTKPEKVTLEELFSYIKQEASKGSSWYYVSCGGCNSKAVKGPTSLMCNNKKCEKSEVTVEAPLPATSDDIPTTMGDGSAPSSGFGDAAGDRDRKAADNLESDDAKRSKSG
ncbi:hypothetical protein F2Q70_00011110 [Brassica cretica]|uniref:Replication factor A C-terminal domain-containing protein n=1 Tax=Brassica cretica TaxID=69181 RepID=A0A8S9M5Z2_BRACR|nr:hypothetical protein F2Q70_00011110 [Brassica cretica]